MRKSTPSEERKLERAFDYLGEGHAENALRLGNEMVERDGDFATAHEVRALALTLLGRIDEADKAFVRAAEIDPEQYFLPFRLKRSAFDGAVERQLAKLPPQFRERLENVELAVEDVPSLEFIEDGLEFDLLGIYIGATVEADDWDLPDRVVLFQRNIENISPDRETLLTEIRDTLLHELGHHFGMEEDTLREIEDTD